MQNSIYISESDQEALTGPVNVSSATQYLMSVSTKILTVMTSCDLPCFRDGLLFSVVDTFRSLLQIVLPTTLLASLSQRRAALLPATDLAAVVTESVVIFAIIDDSVGRVSQLYSGESNKADAAMEITQFVKCCVPWVSKLQEICNALNHYITILRWSGDHHYPKFRKRKH